MEQMWTKQVWVVQVFALFESSFPRFRDLCRGFHWTGAGVLDSYAALYKVLIKVLFSF